MLSNHYTLIQDLLRGNYVPVSTRRRRRSTNPINIIELNKPLSDLIEKNSINIYKLNNIKAKSKKNSSFEKEITNYFKIIYKSLDQFTKELEELNIKEENMRLYTKIIENVKNWCFEYTNETTNKQELINKVNELLIKRTRKDYQGMITKTIEKWLPSYEKFKDQTKKSKLEKILTNSIKNQVESINKRTYQSLEKEIKNWCFIYENQKTNEKYLTNEVIDRTLNLIDNYSLSNQEKTKLKISMISLLDKILPNYFSNVKKLNNSDLMNNSIDSYIFNAYCSEELSTEKLSDLFNFDTNSESFAELFNHFLNPENTLLSNFNEWFNNNYQRVIKEFYEAKKEFNYPDFANFIILYIEKEMIKEGKNIPPEKFLESARDFVDKFAQDELIELLSNNDKLSGHKYVAKLKFEINDFLQPRVSDDLINNFALRITTLLINEYKNYCMKDKLLDINEYNLLFSNYLLDVSEKIDSFFTNIQNNGLQIRNEKELFDQITKENINDFFKNNLCIKKDLSTGDVKIIIEGIKYQLKSIINAKRRYNSLNELIQTDSKSDEEIVNKLIKEKIEEFFEV